MTNIIFYDAEFSGLHKETTLISIGMKSQDSGEYFYAEFEDYNNNDVDNWLQENVINNLMLSTMDSNTSIIDDNNDTSTYSIRVKGNKEYIKHELIKWLKSIYDYKSEQIHFVIDCYAYDWVLLNDLICDNGIATNLPEYINYIPIDLSTLLYMADIDPDISREEYISGNAGIHVFYRLVAGVVPWLNSNNLKHNSLWDAFVCSFAFNKIKKINITDKLSMIVKI